MFPLGPKKSGAVGAEKPFISGSHQKVGTNLVDIHRHRPAGLAHIEQKQRTLGVAGRSHASRIQQRAVVIAHVTHGNHAGSGRDRRNEIVRCNKTVSWHYDFEFHARAFFHGFPSGILQREFSFGRDDLIARLPCQEMGHGCNAGAGPGGERDFFRFRSNDFREGRTNPDRRFEENSVLHVMWKLVGVNRGLHGA